jgi:hypothetical protein
MKSSKPSSRVRTKLLDYKGKPRRITPSRAMVQIKEQADHIFLYKRCTPTEKRGFLKKPDGSISGSGIDFNYGTTIITMK